MGTLEFYVQGHHGPVLFRGGSQLLCKLFFQFLVPGDAQQSGAGTGQTESGSVGLGQGFDLFIIGDQLLPVILVKLVLHGGAQQLFVAQFQGLQHQGTVGYIINSIGTAQLIGQNAPGQGNVLFTGVDEGWYQGIYVSERIPSFQIDCL